MQCYKMKEFVAHKSILDVFSLEKLFGCLHPSSSSPQSPLDVGLVVPAAW